MSPDLDSLKDILTKRRMISLEKFFGRKNAKETAGVDNGEVLDNSVGAGGALQCITLHCIALHYTAESYNGVAQENPHFAELQCARF